MERRRVARLQAPTGVGLLQQPTNETRPSDLWSLGSSHLSQVSCGSGKSGLGGVFVDMVGDGGQGAAEFGWGLGLIGGGEWDEEPVVELGVEHGDADAVRGEHVPGGAGDAADESVEA